MVNQRSICKYDQKYSGDALAQKKDILYAQINP